MTQRHVVIVAPPWYPVPPHGYGGIELVVGLLGDALRQAGDRVTLLGAEGSQPTRLRLLRAHGARISADPTNAFAS